MINAQQVKELRDRTGAGMMDCKKALVATNGDMEEAVKWLRENGIAKAEKKAGRVAAEGVCAYAVEGNKAVVYEVNSETDFVAKNEIFKELVKKIGEAILHSNATTDEEALAVVTPEGTVNELLVGAIARIGEKMTLRRVTVINKTDDQVFGYYTHLQGKIVVVTVLNGGTFEVAKDVCMHVAAMSPRFVDKNAVDPKVIENEKEILTQETINEGKPAAMVEKIVAGRIQKFLKEICLVDQPFVKNQEMTVGQYVANNNATVASYVRLEVGEGIEKKQDDFVAEVMSALK